MPLFMQLYTSPGCRSLLDPNSKVQTDKRIYAKARNRVFDIYYLDLLHTSYTRVPAFSVLPADFRAHFRKSRLNH